PATAHSLRRRAWAFAPQAPARATTRSPRHRAWASVRLPATSPARRLRVLIRRASALRVPVAPVVRVALVAARAVVPAALHSSSAPVVPVVLVVAALPVQVPAPVLAAASPVVPVVAVVVVVDPAAAPQVPSAR